jgi:hypothetical protein
MKPDKKPQKSSRRAPKKRGATSGVRFEAARVDSVYEVLDAIAWLNLPNVTQIAQFAGIDPRTAGKLLKNCVTIGVIEQLDGTRYALRLGYPHKGDADAKKAVVREALVRMPLLRTVRQFLQLGDSLEAALRKAAAAEGIPEFQPADLTPLLDWARQVNALTPGLDVEDLIDQAVEAKEERHRLEAEKRVVFLSHSAHDKPFIRKLATDLTSAGVEVWLDEQQIRVGESIPERIAQGLAESDYFIIALSEHSIRSNWVQRELNNAMMREVSRRNIGVLPVKIEDCEIPDILQDKKYADFTAGYKDGLKQLLDVITAPRPREQK